MSSYESPLISGLSVLVSVTQVTAFIFLHRFAVSGWVVVSPGT